MASFRRTLEAQKPAPDRCAGDARLAAARTDDTVPRKHAAIRGSVTKRRPVIPGRQRPTIELSLGIFGCLAASLMLVGFSAAQSAPPAVGVVRAERQQITQTDEFIGRIQAVRRVALVARVTAFLEKRMFVEGSEVKQGDLLYQLEQPPFQAQVDASKANVEQLEAQHRWLRYLDGREPRSHQPPARIRCGWGEAWGG